MYNFLNFLNICHIAPKTPVERKKAQRIQDRLRLGNAKYKEFKEKNESL